MAQSIGKLRRPLSSIVFNTLLALHDGPLHGYALMMRLEEQTGGKIKTGPGAVYGTIARICQAGLVREAKSDGSGRKRFELTDIGRVELLEEARRIQDMADLVRSKKLATEG